MKKRQTEEKWAEYEHSVQRKLNWPTQKRQKTVGHLTYNQKYKLNDTKYFIFI